MGEFKLSDDVFDQIKDFDHRYLTKEQKLLIDKLILNEELKVRYKRYGLCKGCNKIKNIYWCQICAFQQNFENWTSGNHDVDEFIQIAQLKATNCKQIIEWIEYDRFENVEYLAKGGFGTTYKAIWKDGYIYRYDWDSENNQFTFTRQKDDAKGCPVALKCLHNSQDITVEFLREIESHIIFEHPSIVSCYGITKDPETNNFMMVMKYANNGNLRQYLNNNFNSFDWKNKSYNLWVIAYGLSKIHDKGLVHHDFHCGNILSDRTSICLYPHISDLGLCKPVNTKPSQSGDKKIYGVLPYVAPEVLRGKEYTQASDIYGFGIISYEICTGLPPYHDIAHDEFLAAKICQGLRPKFDYKIPQLILDIIKQCWDADPLKRPKAKELEDLFKGLYSNVEAKKQAVINEQIKEAVEINKQQLPSTATSLPTSVLAYTTHAQAVYTSRLLDFKNLPEPKNANDNEAEYTESTRIDFTNLNID